MKSAFCADLDRRPLERSRPQGGGDKASPIFSDGGWRGKDSQPEEEKEEKEEREKEEREKEEKEEREKGEKEEKGGARIRNQRMRRRRRS